MVQTPKALMTLVRNKLNSKSSLESKMKWFHEKGITIQHKDGVYYLKSDPRGHITELTPVCNNVVFHNQYLCSFPGWPIDEKKWSELKEDKNFTIDDNNIFSSSIDDGHTIFMYWDFVDEEWRFSSEKKIKSPWTDNVKSIIKNIMSGEYCYTYTLKLVQTGDNKGLYLERLFNNKTFKEESIERVIYFAQKFDIKYPKIYILKNSDELEESDIPIIIQDSVGHKYKINEI